MYVLVLFGFKQLLKSCLELGEGRSHVVFRMERIAKIRFYGGEVENLMANGTNDFTAAAAIVSSSVTKADAREILSKFGR